MNDDDVMATNVIKEREGLTYYFWCVCVCACVCGSTLAVVDLHVRITLRVLMCLHSLVGVNVGL